MRGRECSWPRAPAEQDPLPWRPELEGLRKALALIREVEDIVPPGNKRDVIAAALAEADRRLRLGEAQIAREFGYQLCQCAFPPTPMLLVGEHRTAAGERAGVRECPRCGRHDGPEDDGAWTRRAAKGLF